MSNILFYFEYMICMGKGCINLKPFLYIVMLSFHS